MRRRRFCGTRQSDDVRALLRRRARLLRRGRRKRAAGLPLTPLETIAADWIDAHPSTPTTWPTSNGARRHLFAGERPREPFLHLSMHLSISEQISIDQPRGIRQACELLARRLGSMHAAQHEAMECLGRMLWEAQRSGRPPDGESYIDCVRRRATRA
jgi:hypothetical protein